MWYNIDFNKWAINQLPTCNRKPKMIAFVKAMIAPVVKLHYTFLQHQQDDYYKLNHNGQVCYLRKALNDKYDSSLRRIYIGNGYEFNRDYIYTKSEENPRYLGRMYLRERSDYADTGVDFIVFVPLEILNTLKEELKAEINYFKEGVKRYKLVAI